MSGEYCPECGCGELVRKGRVFECDLCGIEVARRFGMRSWLSESAVKHCQEMYAKKRAGTLFFVRVQFDTAARATEHVYEVMRVLHSSGASYAHGGTEVVVQVGSSPTAEQRRALEGMAGVERVRVI